ncbi:MAG: 3-methyl-2-oxobutanoate dehydrogenase subunit VorB [bacterium]|jgi:2-oxoglutarate ferredoxin oxidoreductase subunit alpha
MAGKRVLMKGNEAVAEAAVRAGCRYFFGYPITPQNEIPEYLSKRLPEVGGEFLQSESELAAANMLYGGAGAGGRCMTSSSSCGISLKSEGISYIAAAEVPCVIVDMSRRGPGIGGLQPTQSSYRQATKGGGHGGYRCLVFCPSSVQEAADMMQDAFEMAEKYRMPAYVYADGLIGQVMEPLTLKDFVDVDTIAKKPWAVSGPAGRPRNMVNSGMPEEKYEYFHKEKYPSIEKAEQKWADENLADAEYVVTGFGTVGRIAATAVKKVREKTGKKIGFIRPLLAWPFPQKGYDKIPDSVKGILCIEANGGQMVEDVKQAINGRIPVYFEGTYGSTMPTVDEVEAMIEKLGTGKEVRW